MLVYFPDPYPDELFYSICARYSEMMEYPEETTLIKDLYGQTRLSLNCAVDLPHNIQHLITELSRDPYTFDNLIFNHTMFPLCAAFMPLDRFHSLLQAIRQGNRSSLQNQLGRAAFRFGIPDHLQYCPTCVTEDRANFGECYWHRLHQAPGVKVCPVHYVWLVESSVSTWNYVSPNSFFHAESVILDTLQTRPINQTISHEKQLLQIAIDTDWLLLHTSFHKSRISLREIYQSWLQTKGLSSYKGNINNKYALMQFENFYSAMLLHTVGCENESESVAHWLWRVFRSHLEGTLNPILHHLLAIQFLATSAKNFFCEIPKSNPFGDGPWICRNPICQDYLEPTITNCTVNLNKAGHITGIVCCTKCGFTYKGQCLERNSRIGEILDRGQLWKDTLREMWGDSSLTAKEIAKRLGADIVAIKIMAVKLDLPPTRSVPETVISKAKAPPPIRTHNQKLRTVYRKVWEEALKENPQSTLNSIRQLPGLGKVALWLSRRDKEWMRNINSTHQVPRKQIHQPADHTQQDRKWAELVHATAISLRDKISEKPIRLSTLRILKEAKIYSFVIKHPERFPLVMQILNEVTETIEEFTCRKIKWYADQCRQKQIKVGIWTFKRVTSSKQALKLPRVQAALEEVSDIIE